MAKRTVSFSDYQEPTWEEYTGEDPPPNKWFNGTVKNAKYMGEGDDDQVRFIVEITDTDSPFCGWGKAYYGSFDGNTKWKLQDMLKALQGGQAKDVTVDWENEKALAAWLAKQHTQIKFKTREYNDNITIGKVAALLEAVPGKGKASAPAPVLEPEDDEDDIEDYTEEELGAKTVEELEGILTGEFEADLPAKPVRDRTGAKYKDALVDAILDAQEDAISEEGDENPDAAEEDDEEFDDGFEDEGDDDEEDDEPEPEPEPAPRARRSRTAAPAKTTPAKAAPAPVARRRRS